MSKVPHALTRASSILLITAAALAASYCNSKGGSSNPAAPTATGPGLTPSPSTASVQITINPNPVPFSGSPITDAAQCANYANTWFYDSLI